MSIVWNFWSSEERCLNENDESRRLLQLITRLVAFALTDFSYKNRAGVSGPVRTSPFDFWHRRPNAVDHWTQLRTVELSVRQSAGRN
ncbi:hypothetical protein M3Y95_00676600 [Aphelenchoides besseyi]|nr:hypothetical protein M3Y95_00676600 [Aphelenchoides besseyi]